MLAFFNIMFLFDSVIKLLLICLNVKFIQFVISFKPRLFLQKNQHNGITNNLFFYLKSYKLDKLCLKFLLVIIVIKNCLSVCYSDVLKYIFKKKITYMLMIACSGIGLRAAIMA